MDNDELLIATRELFEARGLGYHSGMSEIANADIYTAWDEDKQIETIASFNYDFETGEFESVHLGFYGAEQNLINETTIGVSSLASLVKLSTTIERG